MQSINESFANVCEAFDPDELVVDDAWAAETGPGDSDAAGPRAVVHFSFCEEELGIQLSWARIQTTLSSVCRALFVVRVFYFGRFQKKMACVFLFCLLVFTWRFVVYLLPGQCFIAGVP